jgi:programmed cell death protein 5
MGDDELAEIRRRRLSQLQQQQNDQQDEMDRQRQVDAQVHLVLLQIMEPEARERLNTIKMTKPDFAKAVEQQLVLLAQSGRLKSKITDQQFKELLRQLTPTKKEFRISRKG